MPKEEKMRQKKLNRLLLIFLFGLISCVTISAQVKPENSSVKIPWDEFRKLLELDKDEFILSWQDFQKILQQTGFKYVPPFQLKDEKVVLSRKQFKNLLNQMKPPIDTIIQPPADFLLTKAIYSGKISPGSAQFRANFDVEIFERQRNHFVKIPFFPVHIALKNVLFNKQAALVVLDNNQHTVTTKETGKHQILIDFSIKATTAQGPWELAFPIPRTAITSLDIALPFKDIAVEVMHAQQLEISERGGQTHVYALLSPTNTIKIRWRKKPPEFIKGPPKVYSETFNLLSIEDDVLRVHTQISLSVLQNTISAVTLKIPEGYSILDVGGNGIEDWREVTDKKNTNLEIPFEYPKKGSFTLTITSEKLLPNSSMAVDFAGFAVHGAIREKGFLGVALKSTSEVTLEGSQGLDKLDVSELPASLINRSQKPLLLGFKYLHHPYSLVLDIKKHEELPVIGTVVDSASGVTLVTEDGKLVHRIVYQIRNTSKQFLELELPQDAQIWSVFVGGEPAKPRLNHKRILIPLNRSRQGATGLVAFEVELIYFQKTTRFGWLSRKNSMFPVPDIIISEMLWSVYLPEGYSYLYFGGSVEKEKMARGFRPLLGRKGETVRYISPRPVKPGEDKDYKEEYRREAGKLKRQFSANLALSEEQLVKQMENETRFSQRVEDIQKAPVPTGGGILPIRIQIPATGHLFRFAKTIVSEEPLTLSFSYISHGTLWFIKIGVLGAMLIILLGLRRKIKKFFIFLREKYQPRYNPFLLIILGLISLSFSKLIAVICFTGAVLLLLLMHLKRQ